MTCMKKEKGEKPPFGTKEWSAASVNCVTGCSHDCRYCYAKKIAVRFGRKTAETWKEMAVVPGKVEKKYGLYRGVVMFPTSHDVTPEPGVFDACMTVLGKLLAAGNRVLFTSKPHPSVVEAVCRKYAAFKENLAFMFTVGSSDDEILAYWEPGAPKFAERLAALRHTHEAGFTTSVSMEPCLEDEPVGTMGLLLPYVSTGGALWVGSANGVSMKGVPDWAKPPTSGIAFSFIVASVKDAFPDEVASGKIRWKAGKVSAAANCKVPSTY